MGMLERWRGFSLFQRVLLAILAAMIVGFGIAIPTVAGRKGIEYRDALLRFTQEGEVRRYTGRVDWKRTEFTVRPGGTVEYRWGDEFYGPYQVVEDPAADLMLSGRLKKGDTLQVSAQGDEVTVRLV